MTSNGCGGSRGRGLRAIARASKISSKERKSPFGFRRENLGAWLGWVNDGSKQPEEQSASSRSTGCCLQWRRPSSRSRRSRASMPQSRALRYEVITFAQSSFTPDRTLKPLGRETRKYPRFSSSQICRKPRAIRLRAPDLIDMDGRAVAGWGLVLAARRLNRLMRTVRGSTVDLRQPAAIPDG